MVQRDARQTIRQDQQIAGLSLTITYVAGDAGPLPRAEFLHAADAVEPPPYDFDTQWLPD
ncbi:hypothetical protein [Dactylosporangium salmoneum]|uniref:Uncharacterized protein n=1 Tax=Dactylosporangium salmoneum TaxID=53361 RepID=A0ABN3HE11_9ACTN